MTKYHEDVNVTFKSDYKVLTKSLWGRTLLFGDKFAFEIPKGFQTDFATIPRIFWPLLAPSDDTILVPSIIHDYLYENEVVCGYFVENGKLNNKNCLTISRVQADLILREKMKSFGAGIIKRNLVFMSVRVFGWTRWNKKLSK